MGITNVDGENSSCGIEYQASKSTGLELYCLQRSEVPHLALIATIIQSTVLCALSFTTTPIKRGLSHSTKKPYWDRVGLHYNGAGHPEQPIKNNIFQGHTGYSVDVPSSTACGKWTTTWSLYFRTYAGQMGTVQMWRLVSWRDNPPSKDLNSLSFESQFLSETDLIANSQLWRMRERRIAV